MTKIEEQMHQKGVSPGKLERDTGIPRERLDKIIKGKVPVCPNEAVKISESLNTWIPNVFVKTGIHITTRKRSRSK